MFALRSLRHHPGYATVTIITLGLGIGANTAIFAVVHGVLLRPLPYAEGRELVVLGQAATRAGVSEIGFSAQEVADYLLRLPEPPCEASRSTTSVSRAA